MNDTLDPAANSSDDDRFARYSKQTRFRALGIPGQNELSNGHAIVIGCGALGGVIANTLARAGVGRLTIVDRDFVELNNLQRQVLYDESDVGQPKAIRAAERLRKINSTIEINPVITDVDFTNIESLVSDSGVICDGTDNFETRFLINDTSIKLGIPWIYGGCLGCDGQTMTIVPGKSACLNCLMQDGPPPPGTHDTCDSAGILSPIINVVASIQSIEAIKILSNNIEATSTQLQIFDLWGNRTSQMNLASLRDQVDCETCDQHRYQWLDGQRGSQTAILCGRNAVQLSFPERPMINLATLAAKLEPLGQVEVNKFLLRFTVDEFVITTFPDSRAIINGTEEIAVAKRLYAQYIGS